MASDFQRQKIAGVFQAMDTDSNGFLEASDFDALARRWAGNRGVATGSEQANQLESIMTGWWQTLVSASGRQDEQRITLDDVLVVVDQLKDMPEAVRGTAQAMFDAIDENSDEEISAAEYRQLIETWNGCPTNTDEVFPLLDRNGDGHLSRQEFTELWTEFWAGDDPNAPGTWVFGRFGTRQPA